MYTDIVERHQDKNLNTKEIENMTAKDIAKVMGKQFIAVGVKGQNISYSGSADKFSWWLENREVVDIIAPKNEYNATIIYVA